MKKALSILAICALVLLSCAVVFADGEKTKDYYNDYVGLLTESEYRTVEAKLAEVSEKIKADVVVVIVPDTDTLSAEEYAVGYFEYFDYGIDTENGGVIFTFVTDGTEVAGSRDSAIEVFGKCDGKIDPDEVYDQIADSFHVNDYVTGFCQFADACEEQMSFRLAKCAVISLAIGLIVALLVVSGMKSKLKSVRAQRGATQYTRPDSLIITREREIYLYSTVTRVKREKSSSSSGSSGEMSHSGSSRKL